MTAQTRSTLVGKFEQGDKPQGSDYVDVFDSFVSISDTTAQAVASQLTAPTLVATTEVSAPLVRADEVSASALYGEGILSSITVAGAATITGTVESGDGQALLVQAVQCSAGSKNAATLPSGSDLVGFSLITETAMGSAAGHTVRLGTSGDSTLYGSFTVTDGDAFYGMDALAVSAEAANWFNVTTRS